MGENEVTKKVKKPKISIAETTKTVLGFLDHIKFFVLLFAGGAALATGATIYTIQNGSDKSVNNMRNELKAQSTTISKLQLENKQLTDTRDQLELTNKQLAGANKQLGDANIQLRDLSDELQRGIGELTKAGTGLINTTGELQEDISAIAGREQDVSSTIADIITKIESAGTIR